MTTITPEATKTDAQLVLIDSPESRDELQRRVEWRFREGMPLGGWLRLHHLERAPDETVEMLCDLDVPVAQQERERRGRGGR